MMRAGHAIVDEQGYRSLLPDRTMRALLTSLPILPDIDFGKDKEQFSALLDDDEDRDLEEAGGAQLEEAEQEIADRATAAQTIPELEAETGRAQSSRKDRRSPAQV